MPVALNSAADGARREPSPVTPQRTSERGMLTRSIDFIRRVGAVYGYTAMADRLREAAEKGFDALVNQIHDELRFFRQRYLYVPSDEEIALLERLLGITLADHSAEGASIVPVHLDP